MKAQGKNCDVEFEEMVEKCRLSGMSQHHSIKSSKICVCVRKRPMFRREDEAGEIDAISCCNPMIRVHEPKLKVDGITKFVENHTFEFDNIFDEREETVSLYRSAIQPNLNMLLSQGVLTCFAYGQTGSGKTYTMRGLQSKLVHDLYAMLDNSHNVYVSFYEIYGPK